MPKRLLTSLVGLTSLVLLTSGCEEKCFECHDAFYGISYSCICNDTLYQSPEYDENLEFETTQARQLAIDSIQAMFEDTCEYVFVYEYHGWPIGQYVIAPRVCNRQIGWKQRIEQLESEGHLCIEE